jgi:hypothetical protein
VEIGYAYRVVVIIVSGMLGKNKEIEEKASSKGTWRGKYWKMILEIGRKRNWWCGTIVDNFGRKLVVDISAWSNGAGKGYVERLRRV